MDVLIEQLRTLPLEKRLAIVEALCDSIEREAGPGFWPVFDDVVEEARREIEAHDADPGSSIPWETVRARLFARYG
jgi:putative addiction module component (TIGR02574 family)